MAELRRRRFAPSGPRGGTRRARRLLFEGLENRRLLAACVPSGPVVAALSDCRNWVTYSPSQPYTPEDATALTEEHVREDLSRLYDAGFRGLVTYTLDSTFQEVPRLAKSVGFESVIAGVFWYDEAQLERERAAALEELAYIDALIVGNEGLEGGVCQEQPGGRQCYSRSRLEEEIAWFQTETLKPVSTTETGGQALADPTLLDLGDFATVNIQPWFNATLDPADPAALAQAVAGEYHALRDLRPDRRLLIKEAWYSTSGPESATEENQAAFFEALSADATVHFIWGEAHDQPWKNEPSPFGTLGPGWGLFQSDGTPKRVISDLADVYTGSYNRVEEVLGRAMTVLRRMNDAQLTGGLPLNEATAAQLDQLGEGTVPAGQTQWVPAQVAYGMLAQVGSHAYLKRMPDFAGGLTDDELHAAVQATAEKLNTIFADGDRVYTDPVTQGKALYQRYDTLTAQPLFRDAFENAIPLIDNAQLHAALRVTANYLNGLKAAELDGGVSVDDFRTLASQLQGLLDQMDFRMWFDGADLRIGAATPLGTPPVPASGSAFDRITSETRLAAVAALASGGLTEAEFIDVMSRAIGNSRIGSSPDGTLVERVPFDGTALELVGAAPLLASELGTTFGQGTLLASVLARRSVADGIGGGLPAFGATGVADGGGGFRRLALNPSENAENPDRDRAVLVTVAAGMMAGSLGKSPVAELQGVSDQAVRNLERAIDAADAAGKYHAAYGLPNAIDLGAGVIDPESVWGSLEVAQMATSLLQYKLGGEFFEQLLRRTSGWHDALNSYWLLLNDRQMEAVAPDAPGVSACRPGAEGGVLEGTLLAGQPRDCADTWHVETVGDTLTYPLTISKAGRYALRVRYSNDDLGSGDTIDVLVNDSPVSSFQAEDTGAWTVFQTMPELDLGWLAPGLHALSFRLAATDGFGIDYDKYALRLVEVDWTNPGLRWDVNNDGIIAPVDALILINYLNARPGENQLPPVPNTPPPFYDVANDGKIAPSDVLSVINYLNARTRGEGEASEFAAVLPEVDFFAELGRRQLAARD